MMLRECRAWGCHNLVSAGYCHSHKYIAEQNKRKQTELIKKKNDYGKDWFKIRAVVLKEEPQCVMCGDKSTVVDHIVPFRYCQSNDRGNLQALCRRCHGIKTVKEQSNKNIVDKFGNIIG